jgi:hypothetical protein
LPLLPYSVSAGTPLIEPFTADIWLVFVQAAKQAMVINAMAILFITGKTQNYRFCYNEMKS